MNACQKIVLVGGSNTPSVCWEDDLNHDDELFPNASNVNADLVFINKILSRGFKQCNRTSNEHGVFLDLLFCNFDVRICDRLPAPNEWIDTKSNHHLAHVFDFASMSSANHEPISSKQIRDYRKANVEELKQSFTTISYSIRAPNVAFDDDVISIMNDWGAALNERLESAANASIPFKHIAINADTPPWVLLWDRMKNLIKEK